MDKVAPPSDLALYDTMPYPPEFIRAIRYNLAIELAPEYGVSVAAEIAKPHRMRWKSSDASICKSHRPYLTRC